MITVKHSMNGTEHCIGCDGAEEVYEYFYAMGFETPRYPMPTTMHDAALARHHEWIADCYWWENAAKSEQSSCSW